MYELDNETKLCFLENQYLSLINDALDENYQHGSIMYINKYVHDPNNKWKQHRVDEAIKLLDEYNQKRYSILFDDFLNNVFSRRKSNQKLALFIWNKIKINVHVYDRLLFEIEWNHYCIGELTPKKFKQSVETLKPYFKTI